MSLGVCFVRLSICYPSIFEESESQHTAEVQFARQSTAHPLILLRTMVNIGVGFIVLT